MGKARLEAFSDGVIAIIITIMVLELKSPQGSTAEALRPLLPGFFSYVLSFVYVGIYWNNHHHLLHAVSRVNGAILWANLHLLFWLSLPPYVTAWVGASGFAPWPVAFYGVVLMMAGIAYYLLTRALIRHHGPESALARAVGGDGKGILSVALYAAAIPLAFLSAWISFAVYIAVAAIWFVPDRRIEHALEG
ncbi:MAG: DUF1211 domain-containing protein [Elusimicrobia bacterium]|nr:DUF1211 domain-containing protein [Elusimicrobiota bacterium]